MSKKQQKQNQENMKLAQELLLVCHAIGLTEVTVQEMYLAIVQCQSAVTEPPGASQTMTPP